MLTPGSEFVLLVLLSSCLLLSIKRYNMYLFTQYLLPYEMKEIIRDLLETLGIRELTKNSFYRL